ncbi:PhzF family isomerase [Sporolactobacillus shoreae]|uniref:PhzF family isomerase n=1 Tax=Sporolactobacillus shoreae TaxID=1465501 RepID=A0A4Z0GJS7_9BACL|nr:PhzF family isomerase [Sporolactobacillus shoreae]TGA96287.1 PhzF family isomerase [Sporolactobacillus shoreae]
MKKYHLYQIDSFTKEKFKGNPAGVITNADGLSENDMQRIARELNNSETAFIFSSDNDAYEAYLRFFTPLKEVPSCGHATIAAHYARALENKLDTSRIYQKIGAGILPVEILKEKNDYKIIMTQGKIEFGPIIEGENKDFLLSALGITQNELLEGYPIQIVSTGHSKVMIGIKNQDILNRLKPNYDRLARLSDVIKCNGYYVYTLDSDDQDILVHGRMFAPAIGINEDPVTGNANGPLGAYLVHHQLVKHKDALFVFKAKQGEKIGRSGVIEVEVQIDQSEPVKVKIAGNAVVVFQLELII